MSPSREPPDDEILDLVRDAVMVLDGQWRFRYVNQAAAQLLGRTEERLLDRSAFEVLPGGRSGPFHRAYLDAIERDAPVRFEGFSRVLGRWFQVDAHPGPDRLTLVMREVTDVRRQQRLAQLRDGVAEALEPAQGPTDVLCSALQALRRVTGFDVGELWTRDHGANAFTLDAAEHDRRSSSADEDDWFEVLESFHGELVERIERQQALHDLERLFRLSQDSLVVARLDGYFLRVNPQLSKLLGVAEVDLLDRPFTSYVHPDDLAATSEVLTEQYRGARIEAFTNRVLAADGRYRVLSWKSSPVPEEGLATAVARDVTQERLDHALEEAQREVLQTILISGDLEASLDRIATALEERLEPAWVSIHLHDPDLRRLVIAAAPSLPATLAAGLAEIEIGADVGAGGTAAHRGEPIVVEDLRADPRGIGLDDRQVEQHGIRSCWSIVRDRRGRALRMIGGMLDQTERRELEQQYLRAQRMESIGTLASGIAHDLNNVLSPIVMASDLLLHTSLDVEQRETVDTIGSSARRGAGMVRQVLTFARGLDGERSAVEVATLISDLARIIRDGFLQDIAVAVDVPADVGAIAGDPIQLQQVLLNLAINAKDAMPDGGRLSIVAERVDEDVVGHRAGPADVVGHRAQPPGRDRGGQRARRRLDLHRLAPRGWSRQGLPDVRCGGTRAAPGGR